MGVGISGSRIGVIALALLAVAALCAALATDAGAARLVGKDGRVYACYKAKAPRKGAVRLVPKRAKCRKGERKISWNAGGRAGDAGRSGEDGEDGAGGESGALGEPAAAVRDLEAKVTALTGKLAALEGVLKGITNTELLGALAKLQGISGTQLQETVASLATVKALCTQATKLTSQVNMIGGLFGGIELGGTIPALLKLVVPPAPPALAAFGC